MINFDILSHEMLKTNVKPLCITLIENTNSSKHVTRYYMLT